LTDAIAHILPEQLDASTCALIAHRLLHLLNSAEVGQRSAARLRRRQAGGDSLVRDHFDVSANLIVKLALNLLFPKEVP
jgi:hypothetical protein